MKKGWQSKTLERACQFTNGLWKGEKPPFMKVGVIRNTNFTKEGTLDDSDISYLDVEAKKLEKRRLHFGDIILEKSGGGPKQPVGRVALFDKKEGDYSFSNFTAVLRVLEPHNLDFRFLHKFLYWTYLSGVTEGMQSHSTGIRNLDGEAYKAIKIAFPPLPEQQRIVGIVDEAFEGIATAKANAKKNLQNARALFESHLQSIFTQSGKSWKEQRLGEVAESISTGPFGTMLHKCDYVPDGIPIVNPMNILNSKIVPSSKMMVSEETRDRLSTYVLKAGDIVVARRGELGRCALISEREAGWLCGTGSFFIRLSDAMDGEFFVAFFGSAQFKEHLEASSVGTTMSSLNHGILKELSIPVPPLAEQRRIIKRAHDLRSENQRFASLYERKLAALDELKKSLLHRAFNGEL